MLALSVFLGLVAFGISFAVIVVEGRKEWQYKQDRPFFVIPFIMALVAISLVAFVNYQGSVKDVYNLKGVEKQNLLNDASMTKSLMEKVLVKSDYKALMADLANQGQSKENTQAFRGLVSSLSYYNTRVNVYLYAKDHPYLFFMAEGPIPDLEGLKVLTMADLGL